MTGAGRLAATETIARKVCEVLGLRRDLAGQTVLVTAGPTLEDIEDESEESEAREDDPEPIKTPHRTP